MFKSSLKGLANHIENLFVYQGPSLDPLLNSITTPNKIYTTNRCMQWNIFVKCIKMINESEINLIQANNHQVAHEYYFLNSVRWRFIKLRQFESETNITIEKKSLDIYFWFPYEIRSNITSNATPSENISEVNSTINITNKPVCWIKIRSCRKEKLGCGSTKINGCGSLRKKLTKKMFRKNAAKNWIWIPSWFFRNNQIKQVDFSVAN